MLIAASTVITFISGILIEKANGKHGKKLVVAISLLSNLTILSIFKYTDFSLQTLSRITSCLGLGTIDRRLDLFVSFFLQLVAGPIERSGNLLCQIQQISEAKLWEFERVRDGLLLMFWGLFQKLAIADRASPLVNQVYGNYKDYRFFVLAIASISFAFQIYCDFGGYTNIARGAARVMGFTLMQNFQQPYFAVSIKDFWRRWHISLTSWFTDYLYIPLGGNRKGIFRQYVNIIIVFGISGLWHGANWHFVA